MKAIKKIVTIFSSLALVLSLVACGNGASGGAYKINMGTGGTSGTYYGFSGALATAFNQTHGDVFNIVVQSSGGSKANIQGVDIGEYQMGIVQNDVMTYGYTGTDLFEGDAEYKNMEAIACVYPETVQIVARKGFTSIEELRGKKVSVGDQGSGVEFNARQIFAAYGIDIDKDIVKYNQSFADSADSLKNGTLDASIITAGHPTTAMTELATNYDFSLINLDDEHINKLREKYKFYTKVNIPANTYSPVKTDTTTVAVMATYIVDKNVPEDVVYTFTKALFEERENIQHVKAKEINEETALSGISIPLHKGAEKYYKEIGLMD